MGNPSLREDTQFFALYILLTYLLDDFRFFDVDRWKNEDKET